MSFKTIVVHLNDQRRASQLLAPATALAAHFSAHLVGLHVFPGIPPVPAIAVPYGGEVIADALAGERVETERIRTLFEEASRGRPFVAEWRADKALHLDLAGVVMEHGRAADLIVAAQADPEWELAPVLDFPERLALESGRPVLTVPYAGRFESVPRRVVIAWDGRREAARAAFDALPLLAVAEVVTILTIARPGAVARNETPDLSLAAALARHGIKANVKQSVTAGMEVGEELLSRLADLGADLLVMGAYGHSRMRELVFGGATRHISRHMTVPTLFSH